MALEQINDNFKVVRSRVECPICQEIMTEPVLASCHHAMCNFCAQQLFKLKSTAACPLCNGKMLKRSLTRCEKISGWCQAIKEVSSAIEIDFGQGYVENYQPISLTQMHLSQEMTQNQAHIPAESVPSENIPEPSAPVSKLPPRGGKLRSSFRKIFSHSNKKESKAKLSTGSMLSVVDALSSTTSGPANLPPPGLPLRASSTLSIHKLSTQMDDNSHVRGSKTKLTKRLSGSMTNLISALVPGTKTHKFSSQELEVSGVEPDGVKLLSVTQYRSDDLPREFIPPPVVPSSSVVVLESIQCHHCKECVKVPLESLHSVSLELAHLSAMELSVSRVAAMDVVDEAVQVDIPQNPPTPPAEPEAVADDVVGEEEEDGLIPDTVLGLTPQRHNKSLSDDEEKQQQQPAAEHEDSFYRMVASLCPGSGSPSQHIRKQKPLTFAWSEDQTKIVVEDDETQLALQLLQDARAMAQNTEEDVNHEQMELDEVLASLGIQTTVPSEPPTDTQGSSSRQDVVMIPDTVPYTTQPVSARVQPAVAVTMVSVPASQDTPSSHNNENVLKALDQAVYPLPQPPAPLKPSSTPLTSVNVNQHVTQSFAITTSGLSREEMHIVREFITRFQLQYHRQFQPGFTTHVVIHTVPDQLLECERTLKYFLAILTRTWLVNMNWCKACLQADRLLPESTHEIQGDSVWGTQFRAPQRARESLAVGKVAQSSWNSTMFTRPRYSDLLREWMVGLVEPLGHLSKYDAEMLIRCAGAEIIFSLEDIPKLSKNCTKKRILLTNVSADGFSLNTCKEIYAKYKVHIVHIEWMLDSISKYEVQPVNKDIAVWPKKALS